MKFQHWGYVVIVFTIVLFAFFSHSPSKKKESQPLPLTPLSTSQVVSTTLHSPTVQDAKEAVTRVFGDILATGNEFVSADLNGDGSEDLVVPVHIRPGKLTRVNEDLANWTVQDVLDADIPPAHAATYKLADRRSKPLVDTADTLIAVIHGYGSLGWRDAEARQAYLLLHAPTASLSTASISDLELRGLRLPRTSANPATALVSTVGNQQRALYWMGSQYALTEARTNAPLIARK